MSLILKGIDLPREDEELTLEINHKGEIRAYSTELRELDKDPIAIQIPHPHGRIKDVDNITAQEVFIDEMSFYAVDCDDIDDAPTILEAER